MPQQVPSIRFLMALVAHAALGFLRIGRVLPASKRNVRLLEIEGQRTARRGDLIFAKLADICDAAGVAPPEPATRPRASYLRLVPPDTGGGAA